MTTPSPSNSAETILFAALDHAPEDREAFLATACGEDAALLAEVRALLAAHEAMPESFLAEPASNDILERDLDVTIKAAPGTMPQRSGASLPDSTTVKTLPAGSQTSAGSSTANPSAAVPFIFGKRIAQGGMGAILETEDCKLGRTIAAKVMLLEQDASEDMRQRFIQEAAVLAKLAHPNIVPVYDLGHDDAGQLYYTMKLVKGRTLQNIIDDLRLERPEALREFTLERLLPIFRKVADALAFAHSKGIIHRDLKPENVMVGEFGEVLLMDWGLAKIKAESGKQKAEMNAAQQPVSISAFSFPISDFSGTLQGSVMGTPKYMSPEQAMGLIDELDARSDIFSLGGILYAILTLRPPVEGKTVQEVLEKVSSASITPPTAFGATASSGAQQTKGAVLEAKAIKPLPHIPAGRVPAALSAVAMKALRLDKARRYQDVAAFSADIEAYQNGFATTAEQAGLFTQMRLLVQRHRREFAVGFAAWLIITALGLWFVINLRAKESETRRHAEIAKNEAKRATKAEGEARQALAKSQLDLVEKEFERGKFVESQKILEETPERFRDANWRFLRAHSRDFNAQLSIPGKGSVHRLQFLPQGDRFAARCYKGFIGIFDITGRQMGDWIPLNEGGGHYRVFGIDGAGDRIAFSPSANNVTVQEISTGKVVRRWTSGNAVDHVLLSLDGGLVLAAGGSQLAAYAVETGAPLWTLPSGGAVPALSPDSRTVAILASKTGLDFEIQLLDTISGAVHRTITGTSDNPITGTLQFNQAGDQLALLGSDEVILWNPQTTKKTRALHFPGEAVRSLSPGGDVVATISGSRIRLWDTVNGRLLRSLNGSNLDVLNLAFSPDGKMLLSSHATGGDGLVQVWPIRLGEEISSSRPSGPKATGRRVVFNRDGSTFYACARQAGAWETQSGRERWNFSPASAHPLDLAIHPTDGSMIISLFDIGFNAFTRVSSAGEVLGEFGTSIRPSVCFNRSGQLVLAVAGAFVDPNPIVSSNWFSVLDYPSGKERVRVPMNGRQPFAAFCLEDAAVATAPEAGGITVWDWKAGKPLRQIAAAETGSIACLASNTDGRYLVSGGPDRWIRVWEAATGRLEAAFRAHWEGVRCVKFSPDGREILSGSEDGTVRIHDAVTGEERLAFYGLTTPVADVDLSANGKLIAAISRDDGVAKVWDRQLSSEAASLPNAAPAKEPVAAASPAAKNAPPTAPKPALPKKPQPVLPKDSEGWEDLLAPLTEARVAETGHGWNLKDGELFSPDANFATLPLHGQVSRTSYQVRVKLRQLAGKNVFHIVLPVADRMCGFELDGRPHGGIYTGLAFVNGKWGKDLPGVVEGKQVNDAKPHDLAVTVRLDGANATITTTLDTRPLYAWTGPTAVLSQMKNWATTEPGTLALGTYAGGWAVSEVKVKRLEAPRTPAPVAAPQPTLAETLSRAGKYAEAAQATREFIKSRGAELESGIGLGATRENLILAATLLAASDRDGYRAVCAEAVSRFRNTTDPNQAEQIAKTCLLASDSGVEPATLAAFIAAAQPGLERPMAHWVQLLNALAEYRLGHWDTAADWATKMQANPEAPERGTVAAAAILAMAEHQRKHPAEPAKALDTAQTAIAANWPAGTEVAWHAWLIADLLAKEAEALLAGAETEEKKK